MLTEKRSADVDGDGDQDLVVGNAFGEVKYFMQAGQGSMTFSEMGGVQNPFSAVTTALAGASETITQVAPTLGDMDGDGSLDLLVGYGAGKLVFFQSSVPVGVDMTELRNVWECAHQSGGSLVTINLGNNVGVISLVEQLTRYLSTMLYSD